ATPQRPGLAQFSAGVLNTARTCAEGWPGARKAFISKVWDAIRTSYPEWGLSEIEFKDMLSGAHRAGQLVLAGADLKNKQHIKEFEDSAILDKNTVWHYVRVEDSDVEGRRLMQLKEASPQPAPDRLFSAFEQSITWEDDIWHADPVDVAEVHAKARRKFNDLLSGIIAGKGPGTQDRILLFHGQSGAGKTHLLRALRTNAHRAGSAYFGYAQMTPDVANYADYYLRRLVHSLEKTYDPDSSGESALTRLTGRMVAEAAIDAKDLQNLREASLDEATLANVVLKIADDIVASPKYAAQELDINVVRALLYLERRDPRVDQ